MSNINTYQNYNETYPRYTNPLRGSVSDYNYYEPEITNSNPQNTIAAVGLLQIAAIALQKASEWCGNKLMRGKEFTGFEAVKKVADKMVKDNKLNVSVDFINNKNINNYPLSMHKDLIPVAEGRNAFYMDSAKLAVAPEKKPSLILHELGHAVNASKGKFLKFLQKSRIYSAYAPTAVVIANNALQNSGIHSDFIEKHAGTIGFLSFLPTIIEEGIASFRGVNAAKKTLGKTANLAPLKRNYFAAWLTYLIAGLGLGITTKLSVLENKEQ